MNIIKIKMIILGMVRVWLRDNHSNLDFNQKNAGKIAEQIFNESWVEGEPKDDGDGLFILEVKDQQSEAVRHFLWNAEEDRLEWVTTFNDLEVIRHMKIYLKSETVK